MIGLLDGATEVIGFEEVVTAMVEDVKEDGIEREREREEFF